MGPPLLALQPKSNNFKPILLIFNGVCRFNAYFQQPTNIIEQRDVFLKPFKFDLVISLLLLLCSIGILAELSNLSEISLNYCTLKVLKGICWAVATISQQGLLTKYLFNLE
jgi:hypothetical protein